MSDPISLASQATISQTVGGTSAMPSVPEVSSDTDLERLRMLVSEVASKYEQPGVDTGLGVNGTQETQMRTPGDAILEGMSHLKDGYEASLSSIEGRLDRLASTDPMAVGNHYVETVGLQLDIAKWSMSVMGVDNSAKAGTNTVKELSKGG